MARITVSELLGMNLTAEKYQRTRETGSHNKQYAQKMLQECADEKGHYCGAITLAPIRDTNDMALLDGNSRYNDFKGWADGTYAVKMNVTETDDKGVQKETTRMVTVEDAPQYIKDNIAAAVVETVVLEGLTLRQRQTAFARLNSGKTLTNAQKAGELMTDSFYSAAELIGQFMESHGMLTQAQILNDVPRYTTALVLANVAGVYAKDNKTLMSNIADKEINVDRIAELLEVLEDNEFGNRDKYELVTLLAIMYNGAATVADVARVAGVKGFSNCKIKVSDFVDNYKPNCVHCAYDTSGANSIARNVERFAKMLKKVKAYMTDTVVVDGDETITLAEAAELMDAVLEV